MPVYIVSELDPDGAPLEGQERLIDAPTPAQALAYVTRGRFAARVADVHDVASLVAAGARIEIPARKTLNIAGTAT
jgi:hypothetical protein